MNIKRLKKWDKFYLEQCNTYSSISPCLSRKVGVVIVKDERIISGGYNGPPTNIPHCEECRRFGLPSAEFLHLCPAIHAEANAIINTSRFGVSVVGSTLYINTRVLPCYQCVKLIINAGIREVVALDTEYYDNQSRFIYENSELLIRRFTCEF